jgi:hypothetical protein
MHIIVLYNVHVIKLTLTPIFVTLALLSVHGTSVSSSLDSTIHPIFLTEPTAMVAGSTATATLTASGVADSDTSFDLSSSNTACLTAPSTVTLPEGQSQTTFQVTAVANASGSAYIEASANGSSIDGSDVAVSASER